MHISGTECARARESVSADLDRELHELDERRLQAHLRVCADCFAWAESARAVTLELRSAPLEKLSVAAFERQSRARTWRVRPALAVAPALALVASVVVTLAGTQQRLLGSQAATTSAPTRPAGTQFISVPDLTLEPSGRWFYRAV